jgi:hypothetical protein
MKTISVGLLFPAGNYPPETAASYLGNARSAENIAG